MIPSIITFLKNYDDREQISDRQGLGTGEEVGCDCKGVAGDLCSGGTVEWLIMSLYVWRTVMECHTKTAERCRHFLMRCSVWEVPSEGLGTVHTIFQLEFIIFSEYS